MGAESGRAGPDPTGLKSEERSKILDLIRSGFGKQMAIRQLGIGWERLDRTLRADKKFRREFKNAEAFRKENLVALRYSQAMTGDARALDFMISREDKRDVFTWQRREAEKLRKLQGASSTLDIRQQVGLIKQAGIDAGVGEADGDDEPGDTPKDDEPSA